MKIQEKLEQLGHKKVILIAFLAGFIVRLIPELLSFPYPIGWDTIYYASRIESGVVFSVGSDLVNSWLVYGILVALGNLTQADPFMILKVFAPLLYGGTCAGMYFVAWKRFNWSATKSLLVSVIFSFQLAALTVSWQFYRNVFGMMILLFTIPLIKKDVSWKGLAALSVLSIFTVWGHELAMLSLFFIVFGVMVLSVYRKQKIPYRLFVAILPAVLLFMGNFFWVSPFAIPLNGNLVYINDATYAHPGGLFFLTDYLNVNTPIEAYSSYFNLAFDVGSLFVWFYALLLPLIFVGYFKDKVLNSWSFLLLVGGLGCLVVPFAALFLWARWMKLLIYPLTFFAVNGFWKVTKSLEGINLSRFTGNFKLTKKVAKSLILASIIIGGLFMIFPLIDGKYGLIGWGGTFKYVPSTMQTSSVPLQDVEGVTSAYSWLNSNMDGDSSLIVHDVFDMWSMLYLDDDLRGYLFDFDVEGAKNQAISDGYSSVYFVWWNEDIGWYNLRVQDDWNSVQDYGRISVYKLV